MRRLPRQGATTGGGLCALRTDPATAGPAVRCVSAATSRFSNRMCSVHGWLNPQTWGRRTVLRSGCWFVRPAADTCCEVPPLVGEFRACTWGGGGWRRVVSWSQQSTSTGRQPSPAPPCGRIPRPLPGGPRRPLPWTERAHPDPGAGGPSGSFPLPAPKPRGDPTLRCGRPSSPAHSTGGQKT